MRTNIEIDDGLMDGAMRAGHFKTKKEAVEAGLKLLSRQAAYREILKWEGKLQWDADEEVDDLPGAVVRTGGPAKAVVANEPASKSVKASASKARHGRR